MSKKILVVTGGSRGIGASTALLAGEKGYAVCINYRHDRSAAKDVVAEIERRGGSAIMVAADVAIEADVLRLFNEVDKQFGRVTALVNNAGILEPQIRVEEISASRIDRIFKTNVTGSFLCAREAIRRMSPKYGGTGGAIVNVSSGASRSGSPNEYVDYAASKGAIDSMTIGLSKEVAGEGIRVNAVRPSFIDTDIHASGGEPLRIERVKENIPMRRGGQAHEVAQAILWLLSNEASYTTGSFIDVSGGA